MEGLTNLVEHFGKVELSKSKDLQELSKLSAGTKEDIKNFSITNKN